MPTAAILGASGYAGGELIRLLDAHPGFDLAYLGAHSKAGERLATVHPHLASGERLLGSLAVGDVPDVDVVFLALPHGASAELGVTLAARGMKVVDLGSDFRLDSEQRYVEAYGTPHPYPQQLGRWAYGIPELFKADIVGADLVAAPGCYPTTALLGLGPLAARGLITPAGIIVDAMSGVTGAGRGLSAGLQFGAVAESVKAYKVLSHRHQPEMERALDALAAGVHQLTFTPHLVPIQRGILATIHAPLLEDVTLSDLTSAYDERYAAEPFVKRLHVPPETRWVAGSNTAMLSVQVDERTRRALVLVAIDNLIKGASGQAVQCANLMFGLDETAGLPATGALP